MQLSISEYDLINKTTGNGGFLFPQFQQDLSYFYICKMNSNPFSYQKQKVIQALRFHFISRKEIRLLIIGVNIFALFAAAMFYLKRVSALAFLTSSALWIFLLIVFWYIMPYMVYRSTRTFRDSFSATVDAEGLKLFNQNGSNQWSWKQFRRWVESPHFFFFYLGERSFFIIPKDAFPTENWRELRELFNNEIGKQSN